MSKRRPRSSGPRPQIEGAGKVAIAYVHGAEVAHSWHLSMQSLVGYDIAHNQRVVGGGWFATKYGTGGIVQARNDTVTAYLTQCTAEWLLFIDTDMGFAADSVDRLMATADKDTAPIVGGLCFGVREIEGDNLGGYLIQPAPTLYDWATLPNGQQGFHARVEYEKDAITQVAGTGAAFVLIHRTVFERIEAEHGRSWFSPVFNKSLNMTIGEDLSFCSRAGALGIPIYVDTGVKISHLKLGWFDERLFERMEMIGMPVQDPEVSIVP